MFLNLRKPKIWMCPQHLKLKMNDMIIECTSLDYSANWSSTSWIENPKEMWLCLVLFCFIAYGHWKTPLTPSYINVMNQWEDIYILVPASDHLSAPLLLSLSVCMSVCCLAACVSFSRSRSLTRSMSACQPFSVCLYFSLSLFLSSLSLTLSLSLRLSLSLYLSRSIYLFPSLSRSPSLSLSLSLPLSLYLQTPSHFISHFF